MTCLFFSSASFLPYVTEKNGAHLKPLLVIYFLYKKIDVMIDLWR